MYAADDICDVFCDKCQALYKSVPFDQITMDNTTQAVEQRMKAKCNTSECDVSHDISVTYVVNAVNKMKLFKSDANFELCFNNLIHGCNELYVHLSNVFNCMFRQAYCTDFMNRSSLNPYAQKH